MKTPKKVSSHARRYNAEMIRDFLDQLLAELRVEQLDYSNPGSSSQELGSRLDPFVKKYGTKLLYSITFRDVSDEQQSEIQRTMAGVRQKQIEALEYLQQTVLKEAITCAMQKSENGVEKHLTFSGEDWLKWKNGGTPLRGEGQHKPDTEASPSAVPVRVSTSDGRSEPEHNGAARQTKHPTARKAKQPANRHRPAGGRKRVHD
jgi:hypothetical protein